MARARRNEPCPCGSGVKYKRCCLPDDEAAGHALLVRAAAEAAQAAAAHKERRQAAVIAWLHRHDLNAASRAVSALLSEGLLEEAGRAAQDLQARFPEAHEGPRHLGEIHEARGERRQAAECYRKVIELVQAHPGQHEPGLADKFRRHVARLDPAGCQQGLVDDLFAAAASPPARRARRTSRH